MINKIVKRLLGKTEQPLVTLSGRYSDFNEALKMTSSYSSSAIAEKEEKRAKEFKSDKKSLDADIGTILSQYGALFSVLTKIAYENDRKLDLVDFGGSNGYFYFQIKNFLGDKVKINWTVVELQGLVDIGNKYYANNELSYSIDFDKVVNDKKPTTLLVSGTIQYLEDPKEFIKKFIRNGFEYIIFDRTPFTKESSSFVQVQQVRKPIYDASFPIHILNYDEFVSLFINEYELLMNFPSSDGKIGEFDAIGLVFRKKQK